MDRKKKPSAVEATAGIIKSKRGGRPPTEKELRRAAETAIADDVMARAGGARETSMRTRRGKRPRVRYGK